MVYGIIDIGSNTIRMAIYKVEHGNLEMLSKEKHLVGLAAYIQENHMQQEGIDKACTVLLKFKEVLARQQIKEVVAFATAALRNIDNSAAAVREISDRTGVVIQVISGAEEAHFSFVGAMRALEAQEGILIDIGGASTELVLFRDKQILQVASLPIGSLAMYTKYVKGKLPNAGEAAAIRREVLENLEKAPDFLPDGRWEIFGIGGTFKGLWQLNGALFPPQLDSAVIPLKNLKALIARFSADCAVNILPDIVPERQKTVVPGMIIAAMLADFFSSTIIVYQNSGMREGYLYDRVLKIARDG